MRNDVRRPKKTNQEGEALSSEMMGEIRVVSKRVVDYLVRPIQNPTRDEHDRQRPCHQSTKTKRNEHDRYEIRIPSKRSAGLEEHFRLLRRHLEALHH